MGDAPGCFTDHQTLVCGAREQRPTCWRYRAGGTATVQSSSYGAPSLPPRPMRLI